MSTEESKIMKNALKVNIGARLDCTCLHQTCHAPKKQTLDKSGLVGRRYNIAHGKKFLFPTPAQPLYRVSEALTPNNDVILFNVT